MKLNTILQNNYPVILKSAKNMKIKVKLRNYCKYVATKCKTITGSGLDPFVISDFTRISGQT